MDHWNILTRGTRRFRPPPGSFPPPLLPTEAPGRTFDIKYYTRDARRNPDASTNAAAEHFFSAEAQARLPREPVLDGEGSPGLKNPDALRYDPGGARNTMTTNWAALKAGLAVARQNHCPEPSWAKGGAAAAAAAGKGGMLSLGVVKDSRKRGWAYTHSAKF